MTALTIAPDRITREPARVAEAATRLALVHRARRWGPCPACGAEHTQHDSRPPLSVVGRGLGWWCHACDGTGDAADLVSWRLLGVTAREAGRRFREVLRFLADGELQAGPRPVEVEEQAEHIDVRPALGACSAPASDPEVAGWLAARGIDPERARAGVLPPGFSASWWPRVWSRTWRIVVPAFTGRGELAGLQGRAVGKPPLGPDGREAPKCRWPRGAAASGLLFADPHGARPLLRRQPSPARCLLVVEGLTDYLTACARLGPETAVIGVASGSPAALRLLEVPANVRVVVATDYDRKGETYADQVAEALAPVPVRRLPFRLGAAA